VLQGGIHQSSAVRDGFVATRVSVTSLHTTVVARLAGAHPRTNCTALSLITTVDGNTVRSFSTHGQLSAAQGSSTTVSA
jgi:hypothetical protein